MVKTQAEVQEEEETKKATGTADQVIEDLQRQVEELKVERKKDKETDAIRMQMKEATEESELPKIGKAWKEFLDKNALVHAQQAKVSIKQAYQETEKNMVKLMEEYNKYQEAKKAGNNKLRVSMAGGLKSEGTVPLVDTSKPYTAADVKSGKSRSALQEVLEQMFAGE